MTSSTVHVPLSKGNNIFEGESIVKNTHTHIYSYFTRFWSKIQVLRVYRTSTAIRHRPTFESLPEHRTWKVLRNPPTPPQISAQNLTHYRWNSRHGIKNRKFSHKFITQILKAALSLSMYVVYPWTQWDFSSGLGSLWFFIGCFAYNISNCFPLAVHSRR